MNIKTISGSECKDPKGNNHKTHKIIKDLSGKYCSNCGLIFQKS